MGQDKDSWDHQISKGRRLLLDWSRKSTDSRDTVIAVLDCLEELDGLYRAALGPAGPTGSVGRKRRQAGVGHSTRYTVEKTRHGYFLTERFSSSRLPFRVPQDIYDKTLQQMGKVRSPIAFDELLTSVRRDSRDTLPDYLIRVCLRFWLNQEPPLVEKTHARYRPLHAGKFPQEARRAWKQLADQAE